MTKERKRLLIVLVIFIFSIFSHVVFQQPLLAEETYKIAVVPEYLRIEMWQRLNPLMTYLEDTLGVRFELVIPRSFEQHIEMVKRGEVDFSYQNPYVFIEVWEASSPLTLTEKGKEGGVESRGIIITRKDSGIKKIEDLKGKKISVVSLHSAGGFIAQRIFLAERGLVIYVDFTIVEAKENKAESVVFDVIQKKADAGFISGETLGRIESKGLLSPGETKDIQIIAHTEGTPNWVFSANKKLPAKAKKMVQEALLNIPVGHPVLRTNNIRRFVPVPANYLEQYQKKVKGW